MGKAPSKEEENRRLDHILRWRASGLSMRQYSKDNQLNYGNFKNWCYRWKQAHQIQIPVSSRPNNFIPIQVDHRTTKTPVVAVPPQVNKPVRFELKLLFGFIQLRIG